MPYTPCVQPTFNTSPYRSTTTDIDDRNRDILVELVPKCERQKMVSYVTERMSYAGYDLVKLEKGTAGDLLFHFRKNREIDWDRLQKLSDEYFMDAAKSVSEKDGISIDSAMGMLTHPYLGIGIPSGIKDKCTVALDLAGEIGYNGGNGGTAS